MRTAYVLPLAQRNPGDLSNVQSFLLFWHSVVLSELMSDVKALWNVPKNEVSPRFGATDLAMFCPNLQEYDIGLTNPILQVFFVFVLFFQEF